MAQPRPIPAQQPAPITTEQLQAWIVRRERFRSRVKTLVILVLVVGIGGVVTIWTLFHEQMFAKAGLQASGLSVDWDIDLSNIWHGGETSVTYVPLWFQGTNHLLPSELQNLKKLIHLRSLDLGSLDWFKDDDLAILADLKELTDLQIHRSGPLIHKDVHVRLTDDVIEYIKGLTALKSLSLADNRITDAGVLKLANLTELESLDLENTRITDASLETLKGLKKLKFLRVAGTKVTRAGAAAFQMAMPNTEVTSEIVQIGPEN